MQKPMDKARSAALIAALRQKRAGQPPQSEQPRPAAPQRPGMPPGEEMLPA